MEKRSFGGVGKRALVALLSLCMSLMMVPATAFADIGGNAYEVEVDATQGDASHTTGEDVTTTDKMAVGVVADNGNTAVAEVGAVESSFGGQHAVMVEADNGGTANVTTGNVTQSRGNFGVVANTNDGGKAVVETGDVAVTTNYYSTKNAAVEVGANGAGSSTQVTVGNVTGAPRAGGGIDVNTKGGNVGVAAKDVKGYEFGLNIDNAPTGTIADFTGEKRVTVDSVTQTRDSRYSAAGINAFSYISGDASIVQVNGDVNAAGSRGIDASAIGSGNTSVTVDGVVNANYLGVKIVAGSLGNVNGSTVSTGTTTVRVGGVLSKNWDKGVEIDSNTKGSVATFQADGDVQAVGSGSTGIFSRADGGKVFVVVNGDVSGTDAGLYVYTTEIGSNDVLVTGTISGKNGVDISYDSVLNDSLTVWKIEKASNGEYISSEWNNVPSDDREIFAKKRINYIVKVFGSESSEIANLRAAKDAGGAALDQSHGYSVAKEGTKVFLVVDPGFKIASVTNANDCQVVQQDADGNYFIIVKRGGGIDLIAVIEGDDSGEHLIVIPDAEEIVNGAQVGRLESQNEQSAEASVAAGQNDPLLTYTGVEINKVKLEMKGKAPSLRVTLTNTNNRDVKFDCKKFKVVKADDGEEVSFKTEVKELKANESSVEFEFSADENTLELGDLAYVYYDDKLLGTFAVTEPE